MSKKHIIVNDKMQQNYKYLKYPIPKKLWSDLIKENLIDERCMI